MRGVITGLMMVAASAAAAPAAELVNHPADAFVLAAGDNPSREASPLLDHAKMRYRAQPSGLDRFDPASLRMFGGEIGGEGVKDGAVVSLTWATVTP